MSINYKRQINREDAQNKTAIRERTLMIYGIPYAMILYIEQFDYHFHDAKEDILTSCLYIFL